MNDLTICHRHYVFYTSFTVMPEKQALHMNHTEG